MNDILNDICIFLVHLSDLQNYLQNGKSHMDYNVSNNSSYSGSATADSQFNSSEKHS